MVLLVLKSGVYDNTGLLTEYVPQPATQSDLELTPAVSVCNILSFIFVSCCFCLLDAHFSERFQALVAPNNLIYAGIIVVACKCMPMSFLNSMLLCICSYPNAVYANSLIAVYVFCILLRHLKTQVR